MVRAALFGSAVMIGLIIIPVVHFVTALPSPIIGGYMAGAKAAATQEQAFKLGALMAAMVLVPVGLPLALVGLIALDLAAALVLGVLAVAFVLIDLLAALGAALGGAHTRRQSPA